MKLGPVRIIAAIAAVIALLFASACSADDKPKEAASDGKAAVTASDAWVKAVGASDMMTAVFVTLTNNTDKDIVVESATTDMSEHAELHHMVNQNGKMVMEEAPDGITIPANGKVVLEPGGLHIMVMQLTEAVEVGATHEVTLTLSDDSTVTFEAIAKEFAGANEEYHGPGHGSQGNK